MTEKVMEIIDKVRELEKKNVLTKNQSRNIESFIIKIELKHEVDQYVSEYFSDISDKPINFKSNTKVDFSHYIRNNG